MIVHQDDVLDLTLLNPGSIQEIFEKYSPVRNLPPAKIVRSPLDLPQDPFQCVHVTLEDGGSMRCLKNADFTGAPSGFLCRGHSDWVSDSVRRMARPLRHTAADRDAEVIESILRAEARARAGAHIEVVRLTAKGDSVVYLLSE